MKKLYFLLFLISGLTNAQIINFPDANFKAALLNASPSNTTATGSAGNVAVDTNADGEIQMAEALAITGLQFQSEGINDFSGLENFTNLAYFGSYSNSVSDFHLNGLTNLQTISISGSNNATTVFSFSNLPALTHFNFYYSNITSLTLTNLANVTVIGVWGDSQLTDLNLIGLTSLNRLTANDCAISNLAITNSPAITEINLANSNLTSISITNYPSLRVLILSGNNITDTSGFTNINAIEEINLQGNQISNLVLPTSLPLLKYLYVGSNGFPTINLSGYPSLRGLAVNNNTITSLDLSNVPLLQQLIMSDNPIATADFSNLPNLTSFAGGSTLLSEMDFSNSPSLMNLSYFNNPNLTHINLKSGVVNNINYNTSTYYNLPNLTYICVDEGDNFTYSLISSTPTVPITSYCDFVPGGNYNTITGVLTFDADNNGCDSNDTFHPFMKVKINDGLVIGSSFTTTTGDYTFYTQAGTFNWLPDFENPSWFTATPSIGAINFPDNNNNTATQNFCITANGVHSDVEMVIEPVTPARPGFDAVYKLVYKNNGNQTETVYVNFNFDAAKLQLVSTSTVPYSSAGGNLAWQINNVLPFQSGSILVTLHVNSPMDTPAVNIDDILAFTSFIDVSIDENWEDNAFDYNQIVVGAFDPNDITCLEGDVVSPTEIGNYLHYMIRFENTGTFQAENIVVRTEINPADFDINTLQLLNASHAVDARINGNTVEFVFQNILLESGGHGNVLLKLQSANSLQQGDMVNKQANIYFDYNFPVETNEAETVFQALSNPDYEIDNSLNIYPNPTSGLVNINGDFNIKSTQLFDVQGRLIQTNIVNNTITVIDLSSQSNGIYFVKVVTEKGMKVDKLIKQ